MSKCEPITFQRSLLWLRWLAVWLWEPRLAWLTLVVLAVAALFVFGAECSEPSFRLTGLAVQILGMMTVIGGIRSTGELFGKPTLFQAAKAWISRCPGYQPKIRSFVGTAKTTATASAHMSVHAGMPESPTAEDKVHALERNLEFLRQELSGLHAQQTAIQADFKRLLSVETDIRQRELEGLGARVEQAHTDGLYVAAMGATWLFIGACLSTASVELANLCG